MNLDQFKRLAINDNGEVKHRYVRPNTNLNFPIIDQASNDLRCNVGCHNGTNTTTAVVGAGRNVTWIADVRVYHQGPVAVYLTKVENATTADGSSKWFKIMEIGPSFSPRGGDWEDIMQQGFEVQIPKCIPASEYLMRIEQIAIHVPGIPPQFHVACAQLGVFGTGTELPPESHLVNIPEVHAKGHEGFTTNIYQNFRRYKMPGPPVWSC
ncbi:putative glycoside hydrolase family 61 protein [Venturia nashicola]|uniref:AA9 family lytic polysaccharide monooxygenase n=1 Tax=Venturia nashicola TaxID=86259 RepID=A0A4Z1P3P5_9PEZI|nr:putative glycoside hydrolase family 61 protein [Venturia nashicola]